VARAYAHSLVDVDDAGALVHVLHNVRGLLHNLHCLHVEVCSFHGVHLLLQGVDVLLGRDQVLFENLLALQSSPGNCCVLSIAVSLPKNAANRRVIPGASVIHTSFISRDIFPRNSLLLQHLFLGVDFALPEHFQLLSQLDDSFLRHIIPLRVPSASEVRKNVHHLLFALDVGWKACSCELL